MRKADGCESSKDCLSNSDILAVDGSQVKQQQHETGTRPPNTAIYIEIYSLILLHYHHNNLQYKPLSAIMSVTNNLIIPST